MIILCTAHLINVSTTLNIAHQALTLIRLVDQQSFMVNSLPLNIKLTVNE